MRITKAQKVKAYNELNPTYHITGIEKMTDEQVGYYERWGVSFDELYKRPSDEKVASYRAILRTYNPKEVIGCMGGSQTYSVVLIAENGDTLHITRDNNYLVERV